MTKTHTISMPDYKLFQIFKFNCEKAGISPTIDNFNYFKKGFYSTDNN